jgi:hypothetical protein
MCSCVDSGLFLDTAASSSPNLSQVGDAANTAASSLKRACVGMASPISHLRAACTLIASRGFCALNARCSTVALASIPRATNAAAKRSENCVRSSSAGYSARCFITHHRQDFYGCRYLPTSTRLASPISCGTCCLFIMPACLDTFSAKYACISPAVIRPSRLASASPSMPRIK